MSLVTSEGVAMHLESPSKSGVHKHESSNLLRSAFQKAIERAADKQAAADRVTLKEIGVDEAAFHPVFECDAVATPAAGDFMAQTSASSALAHLNVEVPQGYFPGEPEQTSGISAASQRLDMDDRRSIDTQAVVLADVAADVSAVGENHPAATSEIMASPQPITSSTSVSPVARGGIDQQAFDTLSHLLSRQNSLSDSQVETLTLKVIAGMPGVESLKVQQDQSGQWHLLLQLNPHSRRPEEQQRAQLLAELSRRGHAMGSVSIHRQADSALAEQEN